MATPIAVLNGPSPLPDDLVDAVVDQLNAALVTPGLLSWAGLDLASPGTPLPYLVVGEPDESATSLDTSGSILADGHLTLTGYAPTKKGARAVGDAAAAALQDAGLQFASGTLVFLRQESRSCTLDPDPAPDGGDCWQEARTFHYMYSYSSINPGG